MPSPFGRGGRLGSGDVAPVASLPGHGAPISPLPKPPLPLVAPYGLRGERYRPAASVLFYLYRLALRALSG